MSGVISDYMRRVLLRRGFQPEYALPFTEVEVALTTVLPLANSAVVQLQEPIGGGYRRSNPSTLSGTAWPLRLTDSLIYNAQEITWPMDITENLSVLIGWALISRGSDPRVLAVGALSNPTRFVPGQRPRLPVNSLAFELGD